MPRVLRFRLRSLNGLPRGYRISDTVLKRAQRLADRTIQLSIYWPLRHSANADGAPVAESGDQALLDLAATIQRALTEVHQLERTVQLFTDSSQLLLFDRTNSVVKELGNLQEVSAQCQVAVPAAVVRMVDEGKNPELYSVDLLRSSVKRNEVAKGRVEAFRSLREHLMDEMEAHFPSQADLYRDMRTKTISVKEEGGDKVGKEISTSNGVKMEAVTANGSQPTIKEESMEA